MTFPQRQILPAPQESRTLSCIRPISSAVTDLFDITVPVNEDEDSDDDEEDDAFGGISKKKETIDDDPVASELDSIPWGRICLCLECLKKNFHKKLLIVLYNILFRGSKTS